MHLSHTTGVWLFCLHTQVKTVFSGKCFTFNRNRRSKGSGLIARIQTKTGNHYKVIIYKSILNPFKALTSGVLSYGLQDHWDHLRQDTFDVQWVFIDVVSKCHQNEMIEGPEDMSEDLEGSSMQCKLVENREDFTETYPDLCRQHIYAMYWYIFRDYTEEEFYACFEKKFKEKFVKVRKCRLPWDRQENFTHCETILESVRN